LNDLPCGTYLFSEETLSQHGQERNQIPDKHETRAGLSLCLVENENYADFPYDQCQILVVLGPGTYIFRGPLLIGPIQTG